MKFVLSGLSKEDVTLFLTLIKQHNDLCINKMRFYKLLGQGYEESIKRLLKLHRRYKALIDSLSTLKEYSDKEYKRMLKERSFDD